MKGLIFALCIGASFTGALTQSISPEQDPSEEFGILTIHSGAITVHLQTWTLLGDEVFLSVGSNLTMSLDVHGLLWDQFGNVGCISETDGSINFLPPSAVTSNCITVPWTSDASNDAQLIPPSGLGAVGCANTTGNAYQMFCFSGAPPIPSCTGVVLQPINDKGIISSLTTPTPTSTSSSSTTSTTSSASNTSTTSTASTTSTTSTPSVSPVSSTSSSSSATPSSSSTAPPGPSPPASVSTPAPAPSPQSTSSATSSTTITIISTTSLSTSSSPFVTASSGTSTESSFEHAMIAIAVAVAGLVGLMIL